MTPDPTDAELVAGAQGGNEAAFAALVRRHLPSAQAVALTVLGDRDDARDACQEAFVSSLRHNEECRPADKFRPWLLRIVRNRAIDLRRRSTRRREASLDALPREPADPMVGPAGDAERAEMRHGLETALVTLPAIQREVLLLHDLAGWKHHEISARLGIPSGTIRAHLFHARRAMRSRLTSSATYDR